jgi:two-component system, NarL family, sensor kinase
MSLGPAPVPGFLDSISSLRELYRSSEARSARLRLVIEAGRDLATATSDNLDDILGVSARQAAYFSGHVSGAITFDADAGGYALIAPGADARRVGTLVLSPRSPASPMEAEDEATLALLCQLIAATIERVAHDRERENLLEALREREKRLEHVVDQLFRAQEDERRRVSGELHDGVAQTASALFRRLEMRNADNPGASNADLELANVAQGLVRELRRVISGLRPTALDDLGLAAALSGIAESLRTEGYEVDLRVSGERQWPPLVATALFRVAQESLTNIRKHAGGPCRVEIDLTAEPGTGATTLRVRDFGRGFAANTPSDDYGQHIGIEVMTERMTALGGSLTVRPHEAGGVVVFASAGDQG